MVVWARCRPPAYAPPSPSTAHCRGCCCCTRAGSRFARSTRFQAHPPERFIASDMCLYVTLAKRLASTAGPLNPWDVTHPLGYPMLLVVPDLGRRLAGARRRRSVRHQLPGAARAGTAGRRRLRAPHGPAGFRVRYPLLSVHRVRRPVSLRDPLHLLAGHRVRGVVRGAPRAPSRRRARARGRGRRRAVDRGGVQVRRPPRRDLLLRRRGRRPAPRAPRAPPRSSASDAAVVRAVQAVAAAGRRVRGRGRAVAGRAARALHAREPRRGLRHREQGRAPTSCSATTAASPTSNGGPRATIVPLRQPGRVASPLRRAGAGAVRDDRRRRPTAAEAWRWIGEHPGEASCCRWTTSTTRSSARRCGRRFNSGSWPLREPVAVRVHRLPVHSDGAGVGAALVEARRRAVADQPDGAGLRADRRAAVTVAIATGEVRYRIPFDIFFIVIVSAFVVGDFARADGATLRELTEARRDLGRHARAGSLTTRCCGSLWCTVRDRDARDLHVQRAAPGAVRHSDMCFYVVAARRIAARTARSSPGTSHTRWAIRRCSRS